jgi:hypothetical protein
VRRTLIAVGLILTAIGPLAAAWGVMGI